MSSSMKVLLCEDVEKLGWLGDVVEVSDGYARNYLLPQGRATVATDASIRAISEEKTRRAEQRIQESSRVEEPIPAPESSSTYEMMKQ